MVKRFLHNYRPCKDSDCFRESFYIIYSRSWASSAYLYRYSKPVFFIRHAAREVEYC